MSPQTSAVQTQRARSASELTLDHPNPHTERPAAPMGNLCPCRLRRGRAGCFQREWERRSSCWTERALVVLLVTRQLILLLLLPAPSCQSEWWSPEGS